MFNNQQSVYASATSRLRKLLQRLRKFLRRLHDICYNVYEKCYDAYDTCYNVYETATAQQRSAFRSSFYQVFENNLFTNTYIQLFCRKITRSKKKELLTEFENVKTTVNLEL